MTMSEAAQRALINTTSKQGAILAPCLTGTLIELQRAGLVGPGGGLTRAGSIAAERLKRAAEDAAFGA